jgi:hypothetical protein
MRRGGFHDALENLRYFKYRTIADVRNASAKFVEPMDYLPHPLTPSPPHPLAQELERLARQYVCATGVYL